MLRLCLLALTLPTAALAEAPEMPATRMADLYCTDGEGRRVELGQVVCIQTGCVPQYLARCDMSLNNVMWRKVQDGCPGVALYRPAPS